MEQADTDVATPVPRTLTKRLGSAMGDHARKDGLFFSSLPWVVMAATLSWAVLLLRQIPCYQSDVAKPRNVLAWMCYSDIPVTYQTRNLGSGMSGFTLDFPFITKAFIALTQQLSLLSGARGSRNPQIVLNNANTFTQLSAIVLFFCFLALAVMMTRLTPGRGFAALMVAASPSIMLAGMINWDLVGTTLVVLGIVFWARRKPLWAGIMLGLAGAALIHPVLYAIPIIALCFRANKFAELGYCLVGYGLGFGVPVAFDVIAYPEAASRMWKNVWRPGPDLGSLWFVLKEANLSVAALATVQQLLIGLSMVAIAGLCLLASRRPRLAPVMLLVTMAVLVFGRGYSPQHVLWLLPLVVLAVPRWQDWSIWTLSEVLYFVAVWGHLSGATNPGTGGPDRLYWAAILFRLAVYIWLAANIVHDIVNPDDDVVRRSGLDDPHGGILAGTTDIEWIECIQAVVLGHVVDDDAATDTAQPEAAVAQFSGKENTDGET